MSLRPRFSVSSLIIYIAVLSLALAVLSYPFYGTQRHAAFRLNCFVSDVATGDPIDNAAIHVILVDRTIARNAQYTDENGYATLSGQTEIRTHDAVLFTRFTTDSHPGEFVIRAPGYREERVTVDDHLRVRHENLYVGEYVVEVPIQLVRVD